MKILKLKFKKEYSGFKIEEVLILNENKYSPKYNTLHNHDLYFSDVYHLINMNILDIVEYETN